VLLERGETKEHALKCARIDVDDPTVDASFIDIYDEELELQISESDYDGLSRQTRSNSRPPRLLCVYSAEFQTVKSNKSL
jgi:hypothetical protein